MDLDFSQYLTRSQVAVELKCSGEHVNRLRQRGVLPSIVTPLGHLFDPADIASYRVKEETKARDTALAGVSPKVVEEYDDAA